MIVLIMTGQVWNMTFSFYSSLKNIPRDLPRRRRLSPELVAAAMANGASLRGHWLIWNSIMSVAGAWFFLMACEMFVLGNRDLRLPGLGSYLQTAANAGDTRSILWGLGTMVAIIILIDQLVWRPIIAWAEKFKFEQVEVGRARAFTRARSFAPLETDSGGCAKSPSGRRARPESALCQVQPEAGGKRRGGAISAVGVAGLTARRTHRHWVCSFSHGPDAGGAFRARNSGKFCAEPEPPSCAWKQRW